MIDGDYHKLGPVRSGGYFGVSPEESGERARIWHMTSDNDEGCNWNSKAGGCTVRPALLFDRLSNH